MFTVLRLRVVSDWRHAWKWSSMRFLALGASAQAAVLTADRMGLSAHVPEWVLQGLSCMALFCIVAAGVGRVTTIDKPENPDVQRP